MKMENFAFRFVSISFVTIIFLTFFSTNYSKAFSKRPPGMETPKNKENICPIGEAVETDGSRRLALVVGVGQYKSENIQDLKGPPNDARRFYDLLTSEKYGYGFPKNNVCMLLDEDATKSRFKEVFEKALVNRARENDQVVLYYSGHGGRARDRNNDEPDEYDETFMFHDARTATKGDLVDDEFNQMLQTLSKKTKNVSLFIDSCNSGTVTRAPSAGTYIARFHEPLDETGDSGLPAGLEGDASADWIPDTFPGFVSFAAAKDGSSALEKGGRGVFTDALIDVLSQVGDQPMTYAQASRQIPPIIRSEADQIPLFEGDLERVIFGNERRARPVSWEVIEIGPPLKLGGLPMPGLGVGAEMRIYDGSITKADTRDPSKAKATVVIDEMTGVNAKAHVSAARPDAQNLKEGDLAILVRPADESVKISVRLRPADEPGGIPEGTASSLRSAIADDPEAKLVVDLTTGPGDFELSLTADKQLQLRGTENRVRNTYGSYASESQAHVVKNLWMHARQKALLKLRGEGGGDFIDQQTLKVQLMPAPAKYQHQCADGVWDQKGPNEEQVIPLCHAWQVKVELSKDSRKPLLIGGVILSSDGSTFGFPRDGRKELLEPGKSVIFQGKGETFRGKPPLDVQDHLLVFGTQVTNPVSWHLITSTALTRSKGPQMSGLYRALDRYLRPGTRGQEEVQEEVEDSTWTMSSVTMRVEANQRFLKSDPASEKSPSWKEYTIRSFDIRPYLPDGKETSLYKVLQKADSLARSSMEDGYGYKQHGWEKPTDEENLKLGIDCSRAIWFAFTRSDLPYNRQNQYLPTALMVGDETWMKDQFENCIDDSNLRLGDLLVYRDEDRGDGHVVMVIDPIKKIAWGSHGWDGNARKFDVEPDTGVEYQKIKYKKDWNRWDRTTMVRKACWRYRRFIEEAKTPGGQPGVSALANVCKPDMRCGNP